LPPEPGQVEHYDYEYERNGVGNLFLEILLDANFREDGCLIYPSIQGIFAVVFVKIVVVSLDAGSEF
jgi:hypothetical protein